MNKFKAGDIVRVRGWADMAAEFGLNPSGYIACKFTFLEKMKHLCGQTATVSSTCGKRLQLTNWSGDGDHAWNFSDDMFVLNYMSDLFVPGYVCVLRDGTVCRFERLQDGDICLSSDRWYYPVSRIDTQIMGYPDKPEQEIMAIYGYSKYPETAWMCAQTDRPLIWERKEQKEMTVAEIEKALGYPIKIVQEG